MTAAASHTKGPLDVMRLLAHLFMLHGQPAQAATLLKAVQLLAPDDVRTGLALANACIRAGQPHQALRIVEALQDCGGAGAVLHLLRGQALAAIGRGADAREALALFVEARRREEFP